MIASMYQPVLRPAPIEHRTEPRILLRMDRAAANPKLKPTVFLPGALVSWSVASRCVEDPGSA